MTYQCSDSTCRPCKHTQIDDLCPDCLDHKLVIAPSGNWIYCPNNFSCEWEMSYTEYQKTDTDVIRRETKTRLIAQYESDIETKTRDIARLRSVIADLTKK